MGSEAAQRITLLLRRAANRDQAAEAKLLEILYPRLKRIAASYMRRERKEHTLQTTAVVHEAYLQLFGESPRSFENSSHFYAVAAKAMRNILIDYAKKTNAAKRGRAFEHLSVDSHPVADTRSLDLEELLAVADAMDKLQEVDESAHRVTLMRHYLGMTEEEAARELGLGSRTIRRRWQFGRAFLHKELRRSRESPATAPG